jgi:hypothetical protein
MDRLRIQFTLLSPAEGGHPIDPSRYRPQWDKGDRLPGGEILWHAAALVGDASRMEPGETALVMLEPLIPEYWESVRVGEELRACEGDTLVGLATFLAIE